MIFAKPFITLLPLLGICLAGGPVDSATGGVDSSGSACAFDAYGQSSVLFGQDYDFIIKIGDCPGVNSMNASISFMRNEPISTAVDVSAARDGYWQGTIAVGEASREWTDGGTPLFCIQPIGGSQACHSVGFNARVRTLMVQLIKPLFAPGDVFEAQIVCFGRDLSLCVDAELTCEIVTPAAIVVKQQTVTLGASSGQELVGQFSFPIDERPLLGEYTFQCELDTGDRYSKPFSIQEYTLPRFKTSASFDAPVLITSALPAALTGLCEVEYTFGQAVDAAAVAEFSIDGHLVHTQDSLVQLQLGKYQFSLPASAYSNISPKSALTVVCNATEASGAGTYQWGEASLDVEEYELVVDCCDSASCSPTVKPDQYCVCISAKMASGASLADYAAANPDLQLGVSFSQCGFDTQEQVISLSQVEARNEFCFDVLYPSLPKPEGSGGGQYNYQDVPQEWADGDVLAGVDIWGQEERAKRSDGSQCWSAMYEVRAAVGEASNVYITSPDEFVSDQEVYLQVRVDQSDPAITTGQPAHFVVSRMCNDSSMASFAYIVRSRGQVQSMGDVAWSSGTDEQPFSFPVTLEMAPTFQVTVVGVCSNEIMADMITLPVDQDGPIFASNVELTSSVPASPGYAAPGETITLSINNAPSDAAIGLIGIDQRVLLAAGAQADDIFINVQQIVDALFKFGDSEDPPTGEKGGDDWGGGCGCFFFWPMPAASSSAADIITDADLVVVKSGYNLPRANRYYEEEEVYFDAPVMEDADGGGDIPTSPASPNAKKQQRTRVDFLENIVFTVVHSNEGTTVPVFVGDSITTHELSWFAASPSEGLSAARDTLKVRVFKPLFAMVNAPYAVTRGESFILTVSVCNYQDDTQRTLVAASFNPTHFTKLLESDESGALIDKGRANECTFSGEIGPDLCLAFDCPLVANTVGEKPVTVTVRKDPKAAPIDTIVKQVRGKPEGCPLIIPEVRDKIEEEDEGADNQRCYELVMPESAVPESGSAKLRLYTGLNANVLNNLGNLIRMPYGCGEQTIIVLAPMIYLRTNLEATGAELPPGKMDELMNNMNSGYQRELTFLHPDGSFSAFGTYDASGSTWLTAFVIQVFSEAGNAGFLAVDGTVISEAATWLKDTVMSESGRFPEVGRVCHREMQGGSASGVTLTAFVLRALSTMAQDVFDSLALETPLATSINYIETQIGDVSSELDPYVLGLTCNGIISYHERIGSSAADIAAAVSDYVDRLKELQEADPMDTQCPDAFWAHYNPATAGTSSTCMIEPWHCASTARSIDVETTSYAVMCLLRVEPDYPGIGAAINWLACKQNGNGGFSSTSDTVAALAAISLYSELNNLDTDMDVRIRRDGQNILDSSSLNIVQSEVVHSFELLAIPQEPSSPTEVCVLTSGAGRLYIAIDSFRNEPVCPSSGEETRKRRSVDRGLELTWEETTTTSQLAQFWFCVAYFGDEEETGMALVEIEPLSGFSFEGAGLVDSGSVRLFKREEVTDDGNLALYFDGFENEDICFDVSMAKIENVGLQQPKTVKAYLYYDTEVSTTEMFESDWLMSNNVVDVCEDCTIPDSANALFVPLINILAMILAVAYM